MKRYVKLFSILFIVYSILLLISSFAVFKNMEIFFVICSIPFIFYWFHVIYLILKHNIKNELFMYIKNHKYQLLPFVVIIPLIMLGYVNFFLGLPLLFDINLSVVYRASFFLFCSVIAFIETEYLLNEDYQKRSW